MVFVYSFISYYPHFLLQSNLIDQTIEKAFLGTIEVTAILRKVPIKRTHQSSHILKMRTGFPRKWALYHRDDNACEVTAKNILSIPY